METERFDDLARSVARGESSRRSVLRRFGGGGLAAFLATLGIGGLGSEEAEAKKSCKQRCKKRKTAKKRRRCRKKCNKGCTGTGQCPGTQICVNGGCVDRPPTPAACTGTGQGTCTTGLLCVGGVCVLGCTGDDDCTSPLLCISGNCLLGDECDNLPPSECDLLEVCLLGICIDV